MQSEIFLGTYAGLKARIDVIIATPALTLPVVVKINGGTYLITWTQ